MTAFERPRPDIDKILAAWSTWQDQAEEVLPGRTMADLKIAGTGRALIALAEDNPEVDPLVDIWAGWERGRVRPAETLGALTGAGFAEIVQSLAAAAVPGT